MKALVVSGGGARGAWAVGVLRALCRDAGERFDLVVGTSTGALMAPLAALGEVEALRAIYRGVRHSDILGNRLPSDATVPNAVAALFCGRDGFWGTAPLRRTVERHLSPERWERLRSGPTQAWVSAVDLQTSEVTYFGSHQDGMSRETFVDAMVASASIPVFMATAGIRTTGAHQWVDGGARDLIPLGQAIRLGAREIVGVLLESPDLGQARAQPTIPHVLMRYIGIALSETSRNDVELCELITREIAWRERLRGRLIATLDAAVVDRALAGTSAADEPLQKDGRPYVAVRLRLIRPPKEIGDPLDFDPALMASWEEAGYRYALDRGNWQTHPGL